MIQVGDTPIARGVTVDGMEAAAVSFHQHACDKESHPVAMIGPEVIKVTVGRTGRLSARMGSARNHHSEAHFLVSHSDSQRNLCAVCTVLQGDE